MRSKIAAADVQKSVDEETNGDQRNEREVKHELRPGGVAPSLSKTSNVSVPATNRSSEDNEPQGAMSFPQRLSPTPEPLSSCIPSEASPVVDASLEPAAGSSSPVRGSRTPSRVDPSDSIDSS